MFKNPRIIPGVFCDLRRNQKDLPQPSGIAQVTAMDSVAVLVKKPKYGRPLKKSVFTNLVSNFL